MFLFGKKNLMIITGILIVLLLGNNVAAVEKTNNAANTTILQWKFVKYTKENYGMEIPCADVFVIINYKDEIKITTLLGDAECIEITKDGQFPNNTIMACSSWYGGSGSIVCVSKISNDTLAIFLRQKEEATQTTTKLVTSFKELKRIAIPKDSIIKFEK